MGSDDNKNITQQFIRDITGLSVVDVNFLNPYVEVDTVFQARSIVDVVCRSSSGERFLIEIQKSYQRGFSRRMLYYGAKIFSSQLAHGNSDYFGALRNVVVIAVSNGALQMDNPSHITHHRLLDIETCKCEMEGLEFYFVDLTKFGIKANEMKLVTKPIDRWCYYFKYIHELSSTELDAFLERFPEMSNAVTELSRFNLSEKEYESYLLWKMGLSGDPSSEAELVEDVKNDLKKQIAKKLLAHGVPIEKICIATGLKKEDLVE